jgi:integrase/recombinase XerD
MATTTPSTALVPMVPVFTNTERLALAGFLAAYSGLTRQAYELDLRQFASWCQQHQLPLFGARRADIELFARDLEARGRDFVRENWPRMFATLDRTPGPASRPGVREE